MLPIPWPRKPGRWSEGNFCIVPFLRCLASLPLLTEDPRMRLGGDLLHQGKVVTPEAAGGLPVVTILVGPEDGRGLDRLQGELT